MTQAEFHGRRAGRDEATVAATNYTAAWLVVHFLQTGPEKYRGAFERYLRLVAEGKSHHDAWNRAFAGILEREIDRAIRERLEDRRDPGLRTDYDPPPAPAITERAMSDAEVHVAWIKARATGSIANPAPADRIDVQEALAREPNNPDALFMRAYLHLHANRFDEAEADARRAMELRPNDPRYVEGLALIYRDVVDQKGVRRWEDRLDALLPRLTAPTASPNALNTFAWIAAQRGRPAEGLEPSKRSIRADPGCSACYDTLAALLYLSNDIEAAIGAQQLAMNLMPERAESPGAVRRMKQYQAALLSKRAANDPAWKPPPLELDD
jgi:tetratricopeptide (TPR) repeat protein